MQHQIELSSHNGYTSFRINGEVVVGYQKLDGKHILILREQSPFTTGDDREAGQKLLSELRAAGGDVLEMCSRSQLPFLLPL